MEKNLNFIIQQFKSELSKLLAEYKHSSKKSFLANHWILPSNEIKDDAFIELKKFKNDIIMNNFSVNRMDSKGEYIIRNLFDAYMTNPRQLPDPALDRYCQIKRLEIKKLQIAGFKDWIKKQGNHYEIREPLSEVDIDKITMFIENKGDGREFRLLPPSLIDKLLPYLALDSDFLRSIADNIASMTDVFAQEEFSKLYS